MSTELYTFLMFVKVMLICAIAMLLVSFIPEDVKIDYGNDEKDDWRNKDNKEDK